MLGIERLTRGNAFGVVCPFCGDKRGKMNFRIFKDGQLANTYHCFHCGASGNMLTLYADLKGLYGADRYRQAYREIREALNGEYPRASRSSVESMRLCREEWMAEPQHKDQVYRRMQEILPLFEEHRKNLLERGFTEEQIKKYGFCSTPISGTETLARRLMREGFSLKGIPGFFLNSYGNWDAAFFQKNRGFLCPAYALDGNLSGFQIRLDAPYDGKKYLWFSSGNKNGGVSSKSPATFLGDPYAKSVYVTEGILKAAAAHAMSGYSFLGIPGVSQYKELEKALALLKKNGLEEVQEYFDMDKMMDVSCREDYKDSVCNACSLKNHRGAILCEWKVQKRTQIRNGCTHLYEICSRLGLRFVRKVWDIDEDGRWRGDYKGIDDYWLFCRMMQRERKRDGVN